MWGLFCEVNSFHQPLQLHHVRMLRMQLLLKVTYSWSAGAVIGSIPLSVSGCIYRHVLYIVYVKVITEF